MSSLFGKAPSGRAASTGPRHGPKSSGKSASSDASANLPHADDAQAGRATGSPVESGTGKTTIARLLAAEVADDFSTQEVDASA